MAARDRPQSGAAAGTARGSQPGRPEARPEACVELGPGGLRDSASRESKGRRGPRLGAAGTSSPVAGPPNPRLCGPPNPDLDTPKCGRLDRRWHRGQARGSPTSPRTTRPGRGGLVGGWAGLPGELLPLSSKLPGTQIRGSGSGWTIALGTSPPLTAPHPPKHRPTTPPLPAGPPPGVRPAYLVRSRGGAPAGRLRRARGSEEGGRGRGVVGRGLTGMCGMSRAGAGGAGRGGGSEPHGKFVLRSPGWGWGLRGRRGRGAERGGHRPRGAGPRGAAPRRRPGRPPRGSGTPAAARPASPRPGASLLARPERRS